MRRVHLIVSGNVQGVGYRAWVLRRTQGKHLVGWVKNRDDGTVEIVAEGEKKVLEEFIDDCRKGPDVAWVANIEILREQATGEFTGFEVIY